MKDVFGPYLSDPRESAHRSVRKYEGAISREQALFDLDDLRYILDNRYSGKDYWERQGILFADRYAEIHAFIMRRSEVSISDLCRAMHASFTVGIVDNHFSFASPLTGRLHFSKKFSVYFADLLVEKFDGAYVVITSKDPRIEHGSAFASVDTLFPTLSPAGKAYYLVGRRSWNPVDSMDVEINGVRTTVRLHPCKASARQRTADVCLKREQKSGFDIIQSNCCDYTPPLTRETDIAGIGKDCAGAETLIWDNLGNEGGYSKIPREFVLGLNGNACCEEYCAKLISPVTEEKPCKREWVLLDTETCEPDKGTYDGTVYFLMNSDTASSGETSVLYAKCLRNAVFIGENTMGCNTFGNVASYQLTHSGIVLRVPNMINLCKNPDDCAEGKGFSPDFWVDSEDAQAEVIRWLSNRATYTPDRTV